MPQSPALPLLLGLAACDGDGGDTGATDASGDTDATSDTDPTSDTDASGDTDSDDLSDLTWGASEIGAPDWGNWTNAYVADHDAIWVVAGGALQEYDGSDWTVIASQDEFGFDPSSGNMEVLFDPILLGGLSSSEVYVVSLNALIAEYDGADFTKLTDGFPGAQINDNMPRQAHGSMWVSPTGKIHYIADGSDYNFATWDGTERSTAQLNITVGNLDYPIRVVWGLDDDNIWVGGTTTNPFDSPIHRWNGTSWVRSTLSFTDSGRIVGFWGTAADDMWMASTGSELGGRLFRNTGEGWVGADSGPGDRSSTLIYNDIWGTSNNNLFVASNQGLFRYDGSDWNEIDIGVDEPVMHIHGISATRLVITVGNETEMSFRLVEAN